MKCTFCEERATTCTLVSEGDKPQKVHLEGTPADMRRIVVLRACPVHAARVGAES